MSRRIIVDNLMTAHLMSASSHLKNLSQNGNMDTHISAYITLKQLIEAIKASPQLNDQQQRLFQMIDAELKRISQ